MTAPDDVLIEWGVMRPDGSVLTDDHLTEAEANRIAANLVDDHGCSYLPVFRCSPSNSWVWPA